jgi:hypothetical protein
VVRIFDLPDLPWEKIAGRLEQVAIHTLRRDARLEASGLSAGWQSRCNMTEAILSLSVRAARKCLCRVSSLAGGGAW